MKAIVTGASGFIGSHLCQDLQKKGIRVFALTHKNPLMISGVQSVKINVLKRNDVTSFLQKTAPDYIFHFAAQSLIPLSWKKPEETLKTNIFSTLNLLEGLKTTKLKTRLIIFCSSGEYAPSAKKITEAAILEPGSPYALSKITQDYLGLLYYKSFCLDVVRIRPFFIIGPGKVNDSLSDFSRGIVAVERKKEKNIRVGNLQAVRDFVDIHDALAAIQLIAKKGKGGDVYNICSGIGVKVSDVLTLLLSHTTANIPVVVDEKLFRPIDEPVKIGDNSKLKKLGWEKEISLETSLKNILEYWRKKE